MPFRTDLALERAQIVGTKTLEGVILRTYEIGHTTVSEIKVLDENGENAIQKPKGTYITVDVPPFTVSSELTDGRLDALVQTLQSFLPSDGTVLVVGLGNMAITADALGPKTANLIFATRHIEKTMQQKIGLGELRPVAVLTPGVLGCTGMEAFEIITALVQKIKPQTVITVDALAAKSVNRLARTVQICDSGISPGSGVGNHRKEISQKTVGVPIISVGVPTVVDACSLARDVGGNANADVQSEFCNMFVSPREIDCVTDSAAKLIALGINCALQKNLSAEELLSIV